MGAEFLEFGGCQFPSQRAANVGEGGDAVFEEETEARLGVTGGFVECRAQGAEEVVELFVLWVEEPGHAFDVAHHIGFERAAFLHVDARAFLADDDVAEDDDLRVFGEVDGPLRGGVGKHIELERRLLGREREHEPRTVVLLREFFDEVACDAAEAELDAVAEAEELVGGAGVERVGKAEVGVHRVAGDVEAEEFFLELEAVGGGEIVLLFGLAVARRGFFGGGGFLGEHVEETALAGGSVAGVGDGGSEGGIDVVEEFFARGAAEVEGAGFHEVLEDAFVEGLGVDAGDEVVEVGKGAGFFAFFDDLERGAFADAFDAGHAEADFLADGGEHVAGLVHVGAEHDEAHRLAFGDEVGDFFGVAQLGTEHGGHELGGVVGLQITGLVAENRVGGGVGFVETVAGEFVEDVEDRVGGFRGNVVHAEGAFDELGAFLGHGLGVLFAHGAAEHVGAAERVAGDDFGGLHNLLLIDHDAVGFLTDGFEERVRVGDGGRIFFAFNVVGNPLHRAGAVEGDQRDDLIHGGKADLAAEILHAAGLQLEDAGGAAGVEQCKGFGVFEGYFLDVEIGVGGAADVGDGVGDDGERLEAEEVHLQQTELADGVHIELHGDVAFLQGERDEFVEGFVGDDDAGGVFAGIAHHAFEDAGGLEDFFGDGVAVELGAELGGFLDGFFEGHLELVGDHLGEAVGVGVGEVVDTGDVADDGLGAEGAVGDDVGDAVVAVFLADVVDDLDAAAHAEVDVEVGWGNALGIQEAFEEKFEAERVEVGDAEHVGDETAGARAAAGADGNVLGARPVDEIPDDEEVVHEAGEADDREFVVEAENEFFVLGERGVVGRRGLLARGKREQRGETGGEDGMVGDLGGVEAVALGEAGGAEFCEIGEGSDVARGDLDGQRITRVTFGTLWEGNRQVAHVGDELGVVERVGALAEEGEHLVTGLQVELGSGKLHPVLLLDLRAGLDAQHSVVRGGVRVVDVVNVVRADDLQTEFLGELQEVGDDLELLGDAVVLDFDEVVFTSEDFHEASAGLACLLVAVVQEMLRHDCGEAAGEADEAVGIFGERFEVCARFVVKTFEVRVGDELEEILVTSEIFCQQSHVVIVFTVLGFTGFFEAGTFDDIDLASDEWLDAFAFGGIVELDCAKHVAVVGKSQGFHAHVTCTLHKTINTAGAVEQAVVGVDVEVDEVRIGERHIG